MGWMTRTLFGKYVRYHADLKEKDPTAVWADRFKNFEEHCLGHNIPTFYGGAIDGAKDAVVELGKNDPEVVTRAAMNAFDKLPLSAQAKKDFVDGFDGGIDKDALYRYIKAHQTK